MQELDTEDCAMLAAVWRAKTMTEAAAKLSLTTGALRGRLDALRRRTGWIVNLGEKPSNARTGQDFTESLLTE